ncbi:MAG: alpha/beta fold hydrolase [Chloroflexota bacterium]
MRKKLTPRYLLNLLVAFLVALAFAFYIIAPVYSANRALHPTRFPIGQVSPADLGMQYENIVLTTADSLELHGWYVPSQNGAAIIAVHAYNGNRTGVLYHADLLARNGFGVLMLDLRAHGESRGSSFAFGWNADQDIFAALDYLQSRPDVDPQRIGALGLSIGAEIILQAAAEDHRLRAVVAEGAGSRSFDEWMLAPEPAGAIPWQMLVPGQWAFFRAGEILSGVKPAPALDLLVYEISPTPLLLISAGDENPLTTIYFDAARPPKQHWARPEPGHIDALHAQPDTYREKVLDFLTQYLLLQ